MTEWPSIIALVSNLAVLVAGIRVLAMSWEAPQRGSMPLVVTKSDLDRYNGSLNVRQVLLFFFGAIIVIYAICHLAK